MRTLLLLIMVFTLTSLVGVTGQVKTEEDAVRETVNYYLHGLKFNDVESLKKAFHPDARLMFVKRDGQLGELTQEQWYKSFAASAGQEEKGDLKIAALEITKTAAAVKVIEIYEKSKYTDYLSLLKFNGRWQIVNKIYVAEPVNK